MAAYWQNAEDIKRWVASKGTAALATKELMDIIQKASNTVPQEDSISETCKAIIEHPENEEAPKALLGILASHRLAGNLNKKTDKSEGVKMQKQAQDMPSQSRQRNGWVRGMRNKWNRIVDGFNEGTPWRTDRNKFFNFTHYYTDAISFDEDPTRVYSGEALWRMYIMDKFYADYQDKDGKVVGGYINDRFHRFPTAGTPAVPDTDRFGGNSMELANGERTRKPRPHQYSTERRLEEARGNETYDLEVAASTGFERIVKIASTLDPERKDDRVYNILKDTLEMREAGIDYKTMLNAVADHYEASVLGVAQIDKFGQDMVKKHQKVAYHVTQADNTDGLVTIGQLLRDPQNLVGKNVTIPKDGAQVISADTKQVVNVPGGTEFRFDGDGFVVAKSSTAIGVANEKFMFSDTNTPARVSDEFRSAAIDLGLEDDQIKGVKEAVEQVAGPKAGAALQSPEEQGFNITDATPVTAETPLQ